MQQGSSQHMPGTRFAGLLSMQTLRFLQVDPTLMDPICFPLKYMTIGGLLNSQIIPCVGVRIVRPGLHTGEQVLFALRQPAQNTVDHCHRFCTGDRGVGAERAVQIAIDPAQCGGVRNECLRPMSMNIREAFSVFCLGMVKTGTDRCKFAAGDGGIGVKDPGGASFYDAQSGNG